MGDTIHVLLMLRCTDFRFKDIRSQIVVNAKAILRFHAQYDVNDIGLV